MRVSVPVEPPAVEISARARRSAAAYRSGLAAESISARFYEARGYRLRAQRWRGSGGEIDLIMQRGDDIVFVEVKKARCFATAAERVSARQMQRIALSAEEYAANLPEGRLSSMRIDVALVNRTGEIEVIENAFGG